MIKLVILDIDGVLTDGRKYYGVDGMPFAKTFCDKDWTSIKRFQALNIPVVFITGDARVNELVAKNRNIPTYLSRGIDKVEFLPELCEKYNVTTDEIVYVGDDLFDINIMNNVGYAFCPSDSPTIVKENTSKVLNNVGGDNVILELFELCEEWNWIPKVSFDEIMIKIEELDKQQTF